MTGLLAVLGPRFKTAGGWGWRGGKRGGKDDSGVPILDSGGRMAISCHLGKVKGELGVGGRARAQFWICWDLGLQCPSR